MLRARCQGMLDPFSIQITIYSNPVLLAVIGLTVCTDPLLANRTRYQVGAYQEKSSFLWQVISIRETSFFPTPSCLWILLWAGGKFGAATAILQPWGAILLMYWGWQSGKCLLLASVVFPFYWPAPVTSFEGLSIGYWSHFARMCRAPDCLGFLFLGEQPIPISDAEVWKPSSLALSGDKSWGVLFHSRAPYRSGRGLDLLEINLQLASSSSLSRPPPISPPDAPGSTSLINRLHTNR